MKTITVSLVVAGLWCPAGCVAGPELRQGEAAPEAEGAGNWQQQQFLEAWTKADTDADGVISRQEFAAMKRIEMLPEDKRQELFKRLDKDGNGSLSREELGKFVKPQDGKHQMMPRLRELDTDKNGSISFEEFKAGELFKKLSPERQEAMFRRLDKNGDGVISPKDQPVGDRPGQAGPPREPRHLFQMLDKNGDGFLTLEEFRQALFVRGLSEAEQKERFEKMDLNRDSKVDAAEFPHPERKGESKPRPEVPRTGEGPK
ncbi:MAG: EF-hand domain-containing protein [Verrucomicrobia bacterium]|nr:EF-hand domain-containing protein [Verrucomicrobiota bacterium]